MGSGVVSLEPRLLPNFDVITLVGVGNDQEWVVYLFLTPQLFYSEGGVGQQIGDSLALALTNSGTSRTSSSGTRTHRKQV